MIETEEEIIFEPGDVNSILSITMMIKRWLITIKKIT